MYRFSKYQTETIGAFSLLFVVVAINDREINPSISFKLQGPESITCHSDFIISVNPGQIYFLRFLAAPCQSIEEGTLLAIKRLALTRIDI